MHYGPDPPPEMCMSDDEDKLLRIYSSEDIKQEGPDNGENNENKPKIADWRYGPAQIWYDMLEVPDSGDGFNYGFKIKQQAQQLKGNLMSKQSVIVPVDIEQDSKVEPIADDAFLMVSQLHWEDEVVWDGNDIKAKVLQKLNSKTNAAGWLPSSGSRTAGAFSQPGKTLPVTANASGKQSTGASGKQKTNQV